MFEQKKNRLRMLFIKRPYISNRYRYVFVYVNTLPDIHTIWMCSFVFHNVFLLFDLRKKRKKIQNMFYFKLFMVNNTTQYNKRKKYHILFHHGIVVVDYSATHSPPSLLPVILLDLPSIAWHFIKMRNKYYIDNSLKNIFLDRLFHGFYILYVWTFLAARAKDKLTKSLSCFTHLE